MKPEKVQVTPRDQRGVSRVRRPRGAVERPVGQGRRGGSRRETRSGRGGRSPTDPDKCTKGRVYLCHKGENRMLRGWRVRGGVIEGLGTGKLRGSLELRGDRCLGVP